MNVGPLLRSSAITLKQAAYVSDLWASRASERASHNRRVHRTRRVIVKRLFAPLESLVDAQRRGLRAAKKGILALMGLA